MFLPDCVYLALCLMLPGYLCLDIPIRACLCLRCLDVSGINEHIGRYTVRNIIK